MPRMSGIEFVSVVRRRFPSIPVIILSGSSPVNFRRKLNPTAGWKKGRYKSANFCKPFTIWFEKRLIAPMFRRWSVPLFGHVHAAPVISF